MIKLWGLLEYKPQWTLTLKGWFLLVLFLLTLTMIVVTQIHSFLAVQSPIKADALLIEGWVSDSVIKGAVTEYNQEHYQVIITTGLPLDRGFYLSQYKNYAELTAATLTALGIPQNKIIPIAIPVTKTNRTATAAKTVKDWLTHSEIKIKSINIYSFDVHTRRSWLLYQKRLSPDLKVGAIAHLAEDYDPHFWWTYSAGFRSISNEALAYVYALLFGDFS
ncbi:ElyC/SanA/YdcF family protein [Aphanothece hegewaldii]|nr:ElyC/SanA/YdcF family protein [Aphanothece hegewaldii]